MKRFLIIPLLLVALVSCEKTGPDGNRGVIQVRVSTGGTKGTVTTTEGLMSSGRFSMAAYISDDYVEKDDDGEVVMEDGSPKIVPGGEYFSGDGNVTLKSGSWSIADDPLWIADVKTHFWAWHPVSVTGRSVPVPVIGAPQPGGEKYPYTGALTFSYTIPSPDGATDADVAEDLLFAYAVKKYVGKENPSSADRTVDLTFHHALSQVRFCVSTDDGTFDKGLKIKSISISNLALSGNAIFADSEFVWSEQSGQSTFGQQYNADFSTSTVKGWTKGSYTKESVTYNLYTCENVFFMIPQTVSRKSDNAESNMLTVVFDHNGTEMTKSVPITGENSAVGAATEWLGDHYYTYKINATTLGRDIEFSLSLVGWTNRKDDILI